MASKRASIMIVIALIRGELIMGQAWLGAHMFCFYVETAPTGAPCPT